MCFIIEYYNIQYNLGFELCPSCTHKQCVAVCCSVSQCVVVSLILPQSPFKHKPTHTVSLSLSLTHTHTFTRNTYGSSSSKADALHISFSIVSRVPKHCSPRTSRTKREPHTHTHTHTHTHSVFPHVYAPFHPPTLSPSVSQSLSGCCCGRIVEVCCSLLQCAAVCCSVLQCVLIWALSRENSRGMWIYFAK